MSAATETQAAQSDSQVPQETPVATEQVVQDQNVTPEEVQRDKVRPPEQFIPREDKPAEVVAGVVGPEPELEIQFDAQKPDTWVSLYPKGAKLFSYTPKTTGESILFPMEFPQPDAVQVWEIYDKPMHFQTWEWMKWAKLPRFIQRKAVELLRDSPDEYYDMFDKWLKATNGARLGE